MTMIIFIKENVARKKILREREKVFVLAALTCQKLNNMNEVQAPKKHIKLIM